MGDRRGTWARLAGILGAMIVFVALILGSIGLTRLDSLLKVAIPTHIAYAPTLTLYPTSIPSATPTGAPAPTVIITPTPRSPLVSQCLTPAGWLPYFVQPGETLVVLAARSGSSAYLLMQANCLGVAEVQTGDLLYLPSSVVRTPTPRSYSCGPPLTWQRVYVRSGDTLYSLARFYGTTIEAIRAANCLSSYMIIEGQVLFLPPFMVITPTPWLMPPTWTPTLPAPTSTPPPDEPPVTPPPDEPTPTPTPTPTLPEPTPTDTPTQPTPTDTPTPTEPTPTDTPTPTVPPDENTPTATLTPEPTVESLAPLVASRSSSRAR